MSDWGDAFDRVTEERRIEDMTTDQLCEAERLANELLDALTELGG